MELKFKWICTCPACPEQYDVFVGDKQVAYVRLRYGELSVNPYTDDKDIDWNTELYRHQFEDGWKGDFDDEGERGKYQKEIEEVILKYINEDTAVD
jgi:hypothetical protein